MKRDSNGKRAMHHEGKINTDNRCSSPRYLSSKRNAMVRRARRANGNRLHG